GEAALGAGYLVGDVSFVFDRRRAVAGVWHLLAIRAGDCIECGNAAAVGQHSLFESEVRPQRREERDGRMSHEGIRIVSAEEASREAATEKKLPVDAATPAKVRVHKTEGTGMEIEWKDGHRSSWNFAWLRDACPCATCHEERESSG